MSDKVEPTKIKGVFLPQKSLRTYEGDIAEVMARKRVSSATIALAESRKKEGTDSISDAPTHSGKKLFFVLVSLIFVLGGFILGYYLYSISPLAPVKIVEQNQKYIGLIPVDAEIFITLKNNFDETDIRRIVRMELAKPQPPETIKEIILQKEGNPPIHLYGPTIAKNIRTGAPDIIVRTLTNPWTLGIYADKQGQTSAFVIVTTNFFQNAFTGMLQWERVMADDIKNYIYATPPRGISSFGSITIASSTTPTTTPVTASTTTNSTSTNEIPLTIQPYFTIQGKFEDRIINNKDTRVFRSIDGNTLFLYSFVDNTKLVIAQNETVLMEIVKRLEKKSFVR